MGERYYEAAKLREARDTIRYDREGNPTVKDAYHSAVLCWRAIRVHAESGGSVDVARRVWPVAEKCESSAISCAQYNKEFEEFKKRPDPELALQYRMWTFREQRNAAVNLAIVAKVVGSDKYSEYMDKAEYLSKKTLSLTGDEEDKISEDYKVYSVDSDMSKKGESRKVLGRNYRQYSTSYDGNTGSVQSSRDRRN